MVITDDELDALQGLLLEAQVLYLRELRPRMDFGTGTVGHTHRVSWAQMAFTLEVEARPGIKGSRPSREAVRRIAGHLVRKGLVELLSDVPGKQLIMRLPMALSDRSAALSPDADNCVSKKADRKPTVSQPSKADTADEWPESSIGAGFAGFDSDQADRKPTVSQPSKADRHPVSVDRDEMMGAGAQGWPDGGDSPDDVGGAGGALSADGQLQDFRAVLGQDGAPTAALMRALGRLKAVLAARPVSVHEMRVAVLAARERGAGDVAAYAVAVLESGSLLQQPAGKVVPLAGRKPGKPTSGELAASALDMALAGMQSGEVQHG